MLTSIGFGAAGVGGGFWQGGGDAQHRAALRRFLDLGGNFIETAATYGEGLSEKLVGSVLESGEKDIVVATKIPPVIRKWPIPDDAPLKKVYPADHVFRCTEESLTRLKIVCIPLQQFHGWTDTWAESEYWIRLIDDLKSQRLIQAIGISVNSYQPENVINTLQTGYIDAVQVIYNIFEQSPRKRLFPICLDYNIGVIARAPLATGALTGEVRPGCKFLEGDFRNEVFTDSYLQQIEQVLGDLAKIQADAACSTLSELALRFALSDSVVSSIIPGMRSCEHVEENINFGEKGVLPEAILQSLSNINFKR